MQEALRAPEVENAEPGTLDRHGRCPPGPNGEALVKNRLSNELCSLCRILVGWRRRAGRGGEERGKNWGVKHHRVGKQPAKGSTTWAPGRRRKIRERLKEHVVPT